MSGNVIKVMLVDDQIQVRSMLVEVLTFLGYQALEASNSEEALELLDKEKPDIALIDVNIPGVDGLALQDFFRKNTSPLPVILMSGSTDSDTIKKAMESGALAFLTKPFDIFELKALLDDFFSSKRCLKGEDRCYIN